MPRTVGRIRQAIFHSKSSHSSYTSTTLNVRNESGEFKATEEEATKSD